MPHRVLGLVQDYVEVERANIVADAAAAGRYDAIVGAIAVTARTHTGLELDDGHGPARMTFDALNPRQRTRLFHDGLWGRERSCSG